jgi:hypothetical protein
MRLDICSSRGGPLRIPKGFRLKAQGCEERATLGQTAKIPVNPEGVVPQGGIGGMMNGRHVDSAPCLINTPLKEIC